MPTTSPVGFEVRNNMKLTDEEEARDRKAMDELSNRIRASENEIARLQDRLIVLNQMKKDNEHFIKVHQGLLSPIRRLHPEILQEIFCLCLPIAHNAVLSFKEAPLLLGRVCGHWRRVAYSTPALWSSIHINTAPLTFPRPEARLETIDAWLTRSGGLPLSISISMLTIMEPDLFSREFRPYFNLIVKYVRRWKHLHFQAQEDCDPMRFLMEIKADDLPLLEVLYVEGGSQTNSSYSTKGGVFSAPLLRDLSIYYHPLRLLSLPINWSNLIGLDSSLSNLSHDFKILSLCPNLETCTLRGSRMDSTQSSNICPRIVLPKLRTLRFYGMEPMHHNDYLTLLNNLFAPALRHLSCQLCNWSRSSMTGLSDPGQFLPPEVFKTFLQRLGEPLEELDLRAYSGGTSDLIDLLSLCPGLKRLSLRSFCSFYPTCERLLGGLLNDRLLLRLIPDEHRNLCHLCSLAEHEHEQEQEQDVERDDSVLVSSTCLCPNLEVLNITGADCSEHILLEFLNSRLVDYEKYDIARLHRFRIISCRPTSDDDDVKGAIDSIAEKSGIQVTFEPHAPAPVPGPLPRSPPLHEDPFIEELPVF